MCTNGWSRDEKKLTNQQQQQKYWTQTNESVKQFFLIGLKYIETRMKIAI